MDSAAAKASREEVVFGERSCDREENTEGAANVARCFPSLPGHAPSSCLPPAPLTPPLASPPPPYGDSPQWPNGTLGTYAICRRKFRCFVFSRHRFSWLKAPQSSFRRYLHGGTENVCLLLSPVVVHHHLPLRPPLSPSTTRPPPPPRCCSLQAMR